MKPQKDSSRPPAAAAPPDPDPPGAAAAFFAKEGDEDDAMLPLPAAAPASVSWVNADGRTRPSQASRPPVPPLAETEGMGLRDRKAPPSLVACGGEGAGLVRLRRGSCSGAWLMEIVGGDGGGGGVWGKGRNRAELPRDICDHWWILHA